MLRFMCPGCKTVLTIEEHQRGVSFPCATCGQLLRVPPAKAPPPASKPDAITDEPGTGKTLAMHLEEEDTAPQAEGPRPIRPRRRRRKRSEGNEVADWWRYYSGAMGVFGWVFLGLVGAWLFMLMMTCVVRDVGLALMFFGWAVGAAGNLWILYIAFTDNPFYGTLCFLTCLFTFAYIFMNLEETWRPALLLGLGILMSGSGSVLWALMRPGGP